MGAATRVKETEEGKERGKERRGEGERERERLRDRGGKRMREDRELRGKEERISWARAIQSEGGTVSGTRKR